MNTKNSYATVFLLHHRRSKVVEKKNKVFFFMSVFLAGFAFVVHVSH